MDEILLVVVVAVVVAIISYDVGYTIAEKDSAKAGAGCYQVDKQTGKKSFAWLCKEESK